MNNRKSWLCRAAAALVVVICASPCLATEDAKPNVVFIISDDHDYEHLGFMGNTFVHTPTLDQLANSGTMFTKAHLPMSRCHPTLASFLSGQWPHQSGIYYNFGTRPLAPDNSLPNLLKSAGYATYVEGKYWEGDHRRMGFTHGPGKTAKTFVRKGQEKLFAFLDDVGGKQPFFVWWAPLIPHTPHNPPKKYRDLYDWSKMPVPKYVRQSTPRDVEQPKKKGRQRNNWRSREQASYAMEAWLDDGVTQLVEKLKVINQFDKTLFIFVIDNGWCNGRVSKGSPFEKGVRTPVFFSWPNKIRSGQRFDGLISTNDIYPTILDYAGIDAPSSAAGRSLRPAIEGKSQDVFRDALFGAIYPAFATKKDQRPERDIYAIYVRTEKWKYIYFVQDVEQDRNGNYFRIQSIQTDYPTRNAGDEDLYAIDKDPYEQHDLADRAEHRQRMDDLKARCFQWWKDTGGKPFTK